MMKYLKYTLIILAMLCLLIFLTTKVYFHYDVPEYSGTRSLAFLKDTVEVYTDPFGVPHVFAQNNEDLFFTSGYLIARERLFQLSLLAAVTRGEISKLLGGGYTEHDEYITQNKLFSISNESSSVINYDNEILIQAYCSGINTWIDESEDTLPLSFKILNTKPIKWKSSDVINVVSMMTSNVHQNRDAEWFLNSIKQYFGETKLLEMFTIDVFNEFNAEKDFSVDSIKKDDLDLENQIWELVGSTGSLLQSYVLIIPQEQTVSQKPILIFDDIWGMQQPAKWYDIHLDGGDFNVEGAVTPGFPIPLVGKTDKTSWAFTGQARPSNINNLFDFADKTKTNASNLSISYADTSGFYVEDKNRSQHFDLLQKRLENSGKININNIIDKLSNTNNPGKVQIAHKVAKIYMDNAPNNKELMNLLYNWDINEPSIATETLLINSIYTKLLKNIFVDEFSLVGKDVFEVFISLSIIAEQSINMMLSNMESSWIDDIKTVDYKESLTEIVIMSVNEALSEIEKEFGTNIQNQQLEKANTKTYKHILYDRSFIAKLFDLNVNLINYSPSYNNMRINDIGDLNNQISGISIRRIFDLSGMNTSYSILPTGQSGLPKSVHYSDQVELFNQNKFHQIKFDETEIRSSDQYQKLVLCPVE